MDIETSSAIRLFFPNPSLMLVYFEAIANSLDAGASEISIDIEIKSFERPETLKIIIKDNGDGFTDEGFGRFKTLLKPRDKFHKGIGRLVFLNYFGQVEINSVWGNNKRNFVFKLGFDGQAPVSQLLEGSKKETSLTFSKFSKKKIKSYDDLKPESLKFQIIDQFLPTLDRKKRENKKFNINFNLKVEDSNAQKDFFSHDSAITLDDLPVMSEVIIHDPSLDAFSEIHMYYHIEKVDGKGGSLVAFSIDGRTIPANIISSSSFPLGYRCVFLFEADIFHANADSSRQRLILPEGISEISLYRRLRIELGKVLSAQIPEITLRNEIIERKFEEQFPHLLGFFERNTVGLIDKDEALSLAQQKFFQLQKEILQCESLSEGNYEKSLDLSSRALTEYILYRDKIIHRMREMTPDNSEVEIHNLIVPRFEAFEGVSLSDSIYQNNAWLLDDKFMVFRTILSEKRMDVVIDAIRVDGESITDGGRPDITMIFSADPEQANAVDVVVVEIKKKTDDEKDSFYAVNQLLERAGKLVEFCKNIQRVWYYAIMDVNDIVDFRLRQMKWTPLFSRGRVYYQEFETPASDGRIVPTPTFVMSFDAIVADAECRNHTFLEILRAGMKKNISSN